MKKIGVFGLWHLGCVITAVWSKLGNQIIGYDYDEKNIENLKKGQPPIFEPFLEDLLKEGINDNKIKFSNSQNDLSICDYIFLSYDTPVTENDESDLSILIKSITDISKICKKDCIIVISSQSPVGFCSELRKILKEQKPFCELAYSPENLRLGEAIKCYLEPERIILGTANKTTESKCLELFSQIPSEVISMNLESAEMVKHGINCFLATSIVFANHIADICADKGAKIEDVIRGIKSDNRIGKEAYLSPGIGFSGGTLGRDLKVLKKINDEENGFAKIFGQIHEYNSERKYSIISKIKKSFGKINNKKIGILGITYKPGTSTLRRSLPLEIVNLLIEEGAFVKVYDPKANYSELEKELKFDISDSINSVCENVDFIVLLTEWNEFKEFNWGSIKNLKIFDTKNCLNPQLFIENNYYKL